MQRLLIVMFAFWVGHQGFAAVVLNDVPVGAVSTPPCSHIHNNGTYSAFVIRTNLANNDLSLFIYDALAAHTNAIPLGVEGIYTNVSGSFDIGFASNRVILAGASGVNPATFNPVIYEFQLGAQTPIPTTLTLITNFTAGVANCLHCTVVESTNGGVTALFALNVGASQVNAVYRRSDGTYTNPPTFNFWGANLTPTFITAAEMPGANSIWAFLNKDSSGWISAGELLFTNSSLSLGRTFQLINNQDPNSDLRPYGELVPAEAISDTASNQIILLYNDSYADTSVPNANGWVTHLTVAGFNNTTNFYLIGVSSQQVNREAGGWGITQIGPHKTIGYCQSSTNVTSSFGTFPFYSQTFDTVTNTPILSPSSSGYFTPIEFRAYAQEYLLRYPDLSFHLLIQPFTGNIYYVDPATGNDTNNGTSQGTAWAHVPGAIGFTGTGWPTSFSPGDRVIVKGGSTNFYQVQFFGARWSGSAAFDSITLQSGHLAVPQWGTTRAIIDENFTNVFALAFGEGGSTTMQGVTLDGFEVRNIQAGDMPAPWSSPGQGGSCCIQIGGNNPVLFLSIRNCYLHDALRSVDNTGHGIEGNQGITNFLIYQNVIGPAIGTKGIEPFSCTSGAISNNLITGTGDHCVALSASAHVDFANNTIITLTNGVHEPTYAISIAGANFCDLWNNVIFQQQGSAFVGGFNDWKSGIGMYNNGGSPSHDNRFINNTLAFFYAVHNGGYENGVAFGGNGATIISNAFFANNIVYNCTNSFGPDALFYSSPLSTNATIKFNDFWSGSGNIMTKNSTQTTVAGFSPDTGTTYASNLQLDPVFTGGTLPSALNASFQPNQGYFALSTSTPSSVRLAGNTVSGDANHGYSSVAGKFNLDIVGVSRTNWSMGAYEWASPPASATNASVIIMGNTTISGNVLIK